MRREARLLPRGATSCCSLATRQPANQSVWPSMFGTHPRGDTEVKCWHDGRPDSPRPSPRCWLRSQMTPAGRAFLHVVLKSPRERAPFISRLSPSERIPLDWYPRSGNSGIDSIIPPRRDIDCICRCRDCLCYWIIAATVPVTYGVHPENRKPDASTCATMRGPPLEPFLATQQHLSVRDALSVSKWSCWTRTDQRVRSTQR